MTRTDLVTLVAMSVVVATTFALDRAILASFAVYILAALAARTRPNIYVVVSTAC